MEIVLIPFNPPAVLGTLILVCTPISLSSSAALVMHPLLPMPVIYLDLWAPQSDSYLMLSS